MTSRMATNQQDIGSILGVSIEKFGLTPEEQTFFVSTLVNNVDFSKCKRKTKQTSNAGLNGGTTPPTTTIKDLDANILNCILKNLYTEDLKSVRSTNTSLFNAVMPLFTKVDEANLHPIFENLLKILLELEEVSLDVHKLDASGFYRPFALTLTEGNICINIDSKVVFNGSFDSSIPEYLKESVKTFSSLSDDDKKKIISAIKGQLSDYTFMLNVYPKVSNTPTQNPKKSLLKKILLKLDLIKVSRKPTEIPTAQDLLKELQAVDNPYKFTYKLNAKKGGARSYESMTVVELKKRCAKRGLKNYSMLRKADIIRLLRK
jgi:hypothetical protein